MESPVCHLKVQIKREDVPSHHRRPLIGEVERFTSGLIPCWNHMSCFTIVQTPLANGPSMSSPASLTLVRSNVPTVVAFVPVSKQDPGYLDHLSPESYCSHLQQDTQRAIARAAAEEQGQSPEALLNAVRREREHTARITLIITSSHASIITHDASWHGGTTRFSPKAP